MAITMQCEDGRKTKLAWDSIDGCFSVVGDADSLTEWEERALCEDRDLPGWSTVSQPVIPAVAPKPLRCDGSREYEGTA